MFDVDWEDGAPPKKLALNRGDNPYTVADRFLEQEALPATYRWVVSHGGAGLAGSAAAGTAV